MRAIGALNGYHAALLPRLTPAATLSEMDPSVTLNFLQHGRSCSEVSPVPPKKTERTSYQMIRFYHEEGEEEGRKKRRTGGLLVGERD